MGGKSRVMHFLHLGMVCKILRHRYTIVAMLAHTHRQRLYATQDQPSIQVAEYRAGSILNELQLFGQVAIVQDDGPTNAIAMSIETLGCAWGNRGVAEDA